MKFAPKHLLIVGLLGGLTLVAQAQTPAPASGGVAAPQNRGPMGWPDPAKMQVRVDKHLAELKAKLALSSAQEGAWTAFTAAMKPPTPPDHKAMQAEMEKLTTPERIDKMRAQRTQREAEMDKRAEATKTFYAALTPEQKKVFDTETLRHHHGMMHRDEHKH